MNILLVALASCLLQTTVSVSNSKCHARNYGFDSQVCVCTASYCDVVEPVEPVADNTAIVYTTSKKGLRLTRSTVSFVNSPSLVQDANLTVDSTQTYQKIFGFGGAFTDATGINIASLPQLAQDSLLASYFGIGGIGYNVGRIPIASCDFSARNYTYDDVTGDFNLENFALVDEDLTKKVFINFLGFFILYNKCICLTFIFYIPYIKQAMYMASFVNAEVKLFASPWTAPAWMKTNQAMTGNGSIIGQPGEKYYKTWANYFVRFLEEYSKNGVNVSAVTMQNEPTTGYIYDFSWQTTGFTPELQRDFLKLDLGPTMKSSPASNVEIWILDDQRYALPLWPSVVLNDTDAAKYVSRIAVHWYADKYTPAEVLDETHALFPSVPIFATEACIINAIIPRSAVELGDWGRGESYAFDIIQDLNHWVTGWTDWNLALDLQGGPNWVHNYVDSPIIVNATAGEFYKQTMFYAMGHFSTFLPRDSVRIGLQTNFAVRNVYATAFLNSNNYKVVIILNKNTKAVNFNIAEANGQSVLPVSIPAKAIQTILWK